MGPQELFEGLGLGLAELGEACRGMPHGAVVLAQLRTGIGLDGRRGVAILREPGCEQRQSSTHVVRIRERGTVLRDQRPRARAREVEHGLLAVRLMDVGERRDGEVVVVDVERMAAGIREREDPSGATAAAHWRGTEGALLVGSDEALCHERVEMTAHHRGAVTQSPGQLRGSRRTAVEEGASDALGSGAGEFHTHSVSQMPKGATRGWPERSLGETSGVDAAVLEGIVVSYGDGHRGLSGLDLAVPTGGVTALLGPNGAGKSTAVGVLAGLVRPNAGRARVLGGPPGRLEARTRMHVMVQDDGLPSGAHAAEVVRHVARLRRAPATAQPLIDLLGLGELGRTTIRRLSGGERRRVSLACALVGDPDFVILDEPTAGLDPRGRAIVWEAVAALRDRGRTVLLCTHLLDEAEALADNIAIIAGGRLRAHGPLATLIPAGTDMITFDGPLHLDVESLMQALPEGTRVEEVSPGRYRVDGAATPQMLATVASWCAQHGVQPRQLSIGSESLADAYWRLTEDADGAP